MSAFSAGGPTAPDRRTRARRSRSAAKRTPRPVQRTTRGAAAVPAPAARARRGAQRSPRRRGAPPERKRNVGVAVDERILARRRAVRAEQRRHRRRLVLHVGALLVLGVLATAAARSSLFAITDVRVSGVGHDRAQLVLAAADVTEGENLLAADLGAAAERVESLAWVKSARVARRPPSSVEIAVLPRAPVATVVVGRASWQVDADGVVVAGGDDPGLVRIDAPRAVLPPVGSRVSDGAVLAALAVHRDLPDVLRRDVRTYEASSDRAVRVLLAVDGGPDDGLWLRFGSAEDAALKGRVAVALLEQIRAQQTGEGPSALERVREVDLRAPANPVVLRRARG